MTNPITPDQEKQNLSKFNSKNDFSGLHLIALRAELDLGIVRLENALEESSDVPYEVRKYTERLIETLRFAILALCDLEDERNLSCQNALLEKQAHQRTMLQLQDAENNNEKLKQEGFNLRKSLAKFMC